MSIKTIIRAWKDAEFRNSLSVAERAALPPNPAGVIELSDAELKYAAGGLMSAWLTIPVICPGGPTPPPPLTSKESGCPPSKWTLVVR
jgi:mersacidin/lichenicidin family type 2 lantibiotic